MTKEEYDTKLARASQLMDRETLSEAESIELDNLATECHEYESSIMPEFTRRHK